MTLPEKDADRKALPIVTGVLDYFPDAIAAVAHCSKIGNDQHNPGQPLHWAKEKSTDHANTLGRHLVQRGAFDVDGVRHAAKAAWRALALLQTEIEADGGRLHGPALVEVQGPEPVMLLDAILQAKSVKPFIGRLVKYDDSSDIGRITDIKSTDKYGIKIAWGSSRGPGIPAHAPAHLELVK